MSLYLTLQGYVIKATFAASAQFNDHQETLQNHFLDLLYPLALILRSLLSTKLEFLA